MQDTVEKYLLPSIEKISGYVGCTETLAGVTIYAFGNGATEILTAVIAGGSNEGEGLNFSIGLIFGAGVFSYTCTNACIFEEAKEIKVIYRHLKV